MFLVPEQHLVPFCNRLFKMEEMDPGNALYFPFFALLVGCLLLVLFQDRSPLPYTVVLMLLGILVAVASYHFDLGSISHSIDLWVHVDPPEILLYVFLPPLLYESAFGSDWCVLHSSPFYMHIHMRCFAHNLSLLSHDRGRAGRFSVD